MRLLFLVPARGGSKGFPGKNLALLAGIPLVGRAVRVARSVAGEHPGSRVVCTTDDPAIARVAKEYGADVPFMRPGELATDEARTIDVVRHALGAMGDAFDAVVLLQPTSPLTEAEDIRGALRLFGETGAPVVSVCAAEHPAEWLQLIDEAGRLVPLLKTARTDRRQESVTSYRPNGAVYVASPAQLRGEGFWTPETRGFVMPGERSIDVDSPPDLVVAQAAVAARATPSFRIASRLVGPGEPCFVIAEAGVNHNGSLAMALDLVDAAAAAGADAVKFQTFRADQIATAEAPKAEYQARATGGAESQLDMLRRLELEPGAFHAIARRCAEQGIIFLSTPFDEESADLLETVGIPAYKVPSGELTNLPFLDYLARKRLPLIISTGMATLDDVRLAVETVQGAGCEELSLLHCVSNYPAAPADVNLRAMATMASAFGVPVGYSDHTLGNDVCLAAVALGACVIEKHLTLDRSLPGPDHQASSDPRELASLVEGIRTIQAALGDGEKRPAASECATADVARRSLVSARAVPAGAILTADMVTSKRPGTGMAPRRLAELVGRRTVAEIAPGVLLAPEMFE